MQFDKVISVCEKKDINVWKIAAAKIIKKIKSKRYIVIVPEKDLNLFCSVSPSVYEVINENIYAEFFLASLQKNAKNSKSSMGWYTQQLLKLSALSEIGDDEIALIWDADTVPIRHLEFEKNGKIIFYKSKEYHKPYFKTIENLLSLEKRNDYSYIAQCLPCKGKWINSFISAIEKNKNTWHQSIINSIDFSQASSFSEYETLGTYIEAVFPNELQITNNKWERYGNGLIGSSANLKYFSRLLSIRYDFISFERWDAPYSLFKNYLRKYFQVRSK